MCTLCLPLRNRCNEESVSFSVRRIGRNAMIKQPGKFFPITGLCRPNGRNDQVMKIA